MSNNYNVKQKEFHDVLGGHITCYEKEHRKKRELKFMSSEKATQKSSMKNEHDFNQWRWAEEPCR